MDQEKICLNMLATALVWSVYLATNTDVFATSRLRREEMGVWIWILSLEQFPIWIRCERPTAQ